MTCPAFAPFRRITCGPARHRFSSHVPDDAIAFRYDDLLSKGTRLCRGIKNRAEPFLVQNLAPSFGRQAGATRYPRLPVFKQPPPLQEPEGQVGEQALVADLV